MNWLEINKIDSNHPDARVINRNIDDLINFRMQVDAPFQAVEERPSFRVEDSENEALRREYMIRLRMDRLFRQLRLPLDDNLSAISTLKTMLTQRQGHRS